MFFFFFKWYINFHVNFSVTFDDLPTFSSTDLKCAWKENHKKALKMYDPQPLEDHTCFQTKKETKILNFLEIDALDPSEIISNMLPHSAHVKHM